MIDESLKSLQTLIKALETGGYNSNYGMPIIGGPLPIQSISTTMQNVIFDLEHACTEECKLDYIHRFEKESRNSIYSNDISVDSSGNILTVNYSYKMLQPLDILHINYTVNIK